ncbi:cyclophilin-like fold protein [Arthrobacter sp. D1-17]
MSTVVRFTADDAVLEVVIDEDNPTTRSFLPMLPMTLAFSDYGGKEKVATPTREWNFTDTEGLDPKVGDLFSYKPWGNPGFFYNTDGNSFSNDLTRIGKTEDIGQIELLDGQQVTIVAG